MTRARPDRCRALLAQLSRYLDGDLTGADRRAMSRHLLRCPCCKTMADSLQHTITACQQAGSVRLPADVKRRARARIATLLASGPAGQASPPGEKWSASRGK